MTVDVAFRGAKTIFCCAGSNLEQKIKSSSQKCYTPSKLQIEIKKKKLLFESVKKCFFLRKLTKISNLILCFLEIPKILIYVRLRQGAFLSEDWKRYTSEAVSSLQFFALEMRERKAYRKQMRSNVSAHLSKVSTLEQDWFKQVSLYTASWLFANT